MEFDGPLTDARRPGSQRGETPGSAKATKVGTQWVESRGPEPPGAQAPLGNDPSAGSPTETLLRLLLPLNDQV